MGTASSCTHGQTLLNKACSRREMLALTACAAVALCGMGLAGLPALANDYDNNLATYKVRVNKGYLALRSARAYNAANELGALYTGDTVQVLDVSDPVYWYVYAPSLGNSGYVNKNYLVGASAVGTTYSVKVSKGYLALRTAAAYDEKNEIGALYTDDVVQVRSMGSGNYWYVYSPRYDTMGYVDSRYLVASTTSQTGCPYVASVRTGYLALRSEMAYDAKNEIGAIANGDVVYAISVSTGTKYWYVYSPTFDAYGYVDSNYLK